VLSRGRGAGVLLSYGFAPPGEGSQRCARRLDRVAVVIAEAMWADRPAARTVCGLQVRPGRAVLDGQVLARLVSLAGSDLNRGQHVGRAGGRSPWDGRDEFDGPHLTLDGCLAVDGHAQPKVWMGAALDVFDQQPLREPVGRGLDDNGDLPRTYSRGRETQRRGCRARAVRRCRWHPIEQAGPRSPKPGHDGGHNHGGRQNLLLAAALAAAADRLGWGRGTPRGSAHLPPGPGVSVGHSSTSVSRCVGWKSVPSRRASAARPRARRALTVPDGTRSWRLSSSTERPTRWCSTIAWR
jgi:hypothetical protein